MIGTGKKIPLGSVVKVERVGDDEAWADFRFVNYKKFPVKNPQIIMLDLLDSETMTIGHQKSFNIVFPRSLRNQKRKWIEPNLLRFENYNFKGKLQAGQLFRMPHYYYGKGGAKAFNLENNVQQTFENINIYSCRGCAIVVKGLQHHWQLLNVNITIPPGSKRCITCTADHLHIINSLGFLKMDSCNFAYGNDDCVNIHDTAAFAVKSSEKSIRTHNLKSYLAKAFHKGDMIELRNSDYSPTGFKNKLSGIKTD